MPLSSLDDITLGEFFLLREAYMEKQRDYFEMMANSVQVGYYRAKTGKRIKVFEDDSSSESSKMTEEERAREVEYLTQTFKIKAGEING